jgi:F0F1-type ATP synthase membrane subunit b/b'
MSSSGGEVMRRSILALAVFLAALGYAAWPPAEAAYTGPEAFIKAAAAISLINNGNSGLGGL